MCCPCMTHQQHHISTQAMTITLKNEYELSPKEIEQIKQLLLQCFPTYYAHREYFKQIPHHRLLAKETEQIIGQLAIDYRIIALNDQAIKVWGIIDLCVSPEEQGKGIARQLLQKAETIARNNQLDFMLLFADNPSLYLQHGFQKCLDNEITWLKIDEHKTLGIGTEVIPELMIKEIGEKQWTSGKLDMMGFLY